MLNQETNCTECEDTGFVYEVDLDTLMATGLTEYTIKMPCPICSGDDGEFITDEE